MTVTVVLDTQRAAGARRRRRRSGPSCSTRSTTRPGLVRIGAGADRGAAGDRPAHRRAGAARRPRGRVRLAWDHLHVVPVDQRCLDRAAALVREQPVRLTDAIHLAAAERLPAPVRFVTFDPGQIGVALGLGFDVVSA